MLEIENVCILPVWDTGQLILHCQHSSLHSEDITLVWWIKVCLKTTRAIGIRGNGKTNNHPGLDSNPESLTVAIGTLSTKLYGHQAETNPSVHPTVYSCTCFVSCLPKNCLTLNNYH